MGTTTKIEYCDSTVNPVMGCGGCELWTGNVRTCYAGIQHDMRSGNKGFASDFNKPEMFAGRMAKAAALSSLLGSDRPDKPWLNGYPRMIFISDMGDALSREIPFQFLLEEIVDKVTSHQGRRHFWLWFTKRPARMYQFSIFLEVRGIKWPDNLMPFTSITRENVANRWDILRSIKARYRGISFEPLLEHVDAYNMFYVGEKPSWVITGGESGTGTTAERAMCANWMDQIDMSCNMYGIPHFFKQYGDYIEDGAGFKRVGKKKSGRKFEGDFISGMPEIDLRMFE